MYLLTYCTKLFKFSTNGTLHRTVRALLGLEDECGINEKAILSSFMSDEIIASIAAKHTLSGSILSGYCQSHLGHITRINLVGCRELTEHALQQVFQNPLTDLSIELDSPLEAPIRWEHLQDIAKSPAADTLSSLTVREDEAVNFLIPDYRYSADGKQFDWLLSLKKLVLSQHTWRASHSQTTVYHLASVLDQLPCLSVLNVAETGLVFLPCMSSNLKSLVAHDNNIHLWSPHLIQQMFSLKSLVSLDVSRTCDPHLFETVDSSVSLDMIRQLSEMPNLRYLDVSGLNVLGHHMDVFDHPHPRMSFLGLLKAEGSCQERH